ncbi:Dynein light chain 1 [Diplonema papillatum]|nr:Dynein light chain 1 [Diplonema papillatum]
MASVADADVRIAPDLIKLATGQFDLRSVLSLTLCSLGLKCIEGLDSLSSLTILDLSSNSIGKLSNLEPVGRTLLRLDLRWNQITRLEALHCLQVLEVVKLQGNKVSEIDTVVSLSGLPRLRGIHLQDSDGSHANPVCALSKYRETVTRRIPSLGCLDGEFFLAEDCRPGVIGDGESEDIVIPEPLRWLPNNFFNENLLLNSNTFLAPTAKLLEDLIDESQRALDRADKAIVRQTELKAEMTNG